MNIKLSDLYDRCDEIASLLGLSVNDKFVFDLSDETSVASIEKTFKGIKKILVPANGRYLALLVSNEKPNVLVSIFPETEAKTLAIDLFDVKNQEMVSLIDRGEDEENAITLDNFEDYLSSDEVEQKVNAFLFIDDDEGDEDEDDDDKPTIDSDDDKEDEDGDEEDDSDDSDDKDEDESEVEIIDDEEYDEEDEIEVDDDADEDEDEEDKEDDKDIEIEIDDDDEKEVVSEADETDLGVPPATTDLQNNAIPPAATTVAADDGEVAEDPQKQIRSLLKYYTELLQKTSQDESASTEVVSGIQDIIANLVADLESIKDLEDIEEKEDKEAAKAAKALNKDSDTVSEDGEPRLGDDSITDVPVDQEIELKNPLLSSEILPPNDLSTQLDDVALDPETNAQFVDDTIEIPDEIDIADVPDDPALDVKADTELRGTEVGVGADGLPTGGVAPRDADVDAEFDKATAKPVSTPDVDDLDMVVIDDEDEAPTFDSDVDVPDAATPVVTDAPVDPTTGEPISTPAGDDAAIDAKIEDELRGDIVKLGPDGLPVGKDIPSDEYIDDQIASLTKDKTGAVGMNARNDDVAFVRGDNAINWSDKLYKDGSANKQDNDETVPQALKEMREYAERLKKVCNECGDSVNEVTIGRINKFCNLCATAYDTWHKVQAAMNASNELCEALKVDVIDECGDEAKRFERPLEFVNRIDDSIRDEEFESSSADYRRVQEYINSIKKFLPTED